MIMKQMGLADTKTFLVIVYSSFVLPFVIWLLESYFRTIPKSLEEAAVMDGAGHMKIILHVIIPLSLPGIITTSIFALLNTWDEFLFALIFTNSYNAKTITVAISEFTTRHMIDYGMMTAGGVVAALPPILVSLVLQKYIVNGLTEGSVKE
jgi:multiple sugar transport system permease protein